jgi:hypothetical protein
MMQAVYDSCAQTSKNDYKSSSIDSTAKTKQSFGSSSDAIVVMSMLAVDALIEVRFSTQPTSFLTGNVQDCRAVAAQGSCLFNDGIAAYEHCASTSSSVDVLVDSSIEVYGTPKRNFFSAPVLSFSNLMASPPPPRTVDLMYHSGALRALTALAPSRECMSARLRFIACCLRACNTWSLMRDCNFNVALRISRLCKLAVGDLFSASQQNSEGWVELKTAASDWKIRLRAEVGIAMSNVHACQYLQENRNFCKDIDSFQCFKRASSQREPAFKKAIPDTAHRMSPLKSRQIIDLIRGEAEFEDGCK